MRHLRLTFGDLRLGDSQVAFRADLLVQRQLIIFFRILHETLGHHAVFIHLLGALHIELQEGHVRPFRIDFVALQRGFRRIQRRLGSLQVRSVRALGGFELNFIQFREQLSLLHAIAVIDVKLFHDAAGLGFDLHFGERLNLACSDHHACQVAAFHGSNFGRVNGAAGAERRFDAITAAAEHHDGDRAPDDAAPFLAVFAVLPVS